MVIEYIRYVIPSDRAEAFEEAYHDASFALDASEHCLGYELAHGVEEPDNWILRIDWDSLEGHEHGFRTSPEFQTFFTAVRPFVADIQEMKHYNATDITAADQAARPHPTARR